MTPAEPALNTASDISEPIDTEQDALFEQEQAHRAGFYGLIAGLLRSAPDRQRLDEVARLANVQPGGNELTLSMSMLGLAASTCDVEAVSDEYHALFIGLGRGELVPYGSWYQTGFLMEKPLGQLRDDLVRLGFERQQETREPEDHVAALFEVMMLLINDRVDLDIQSAFFATHLQEWVGRFFADLSQAQAAVFYRAVGRFGAAFGELEQRYLTMSV